MMDAVRIDSLVWDDWNREHARKHGVSIESIESVLAGDPIAFPSYKDRLLMIGPDSDGNMRAVIIGQVPGSEEFWYVFSARPASRKERHRYTLEKGGSES
jgi:uncharacterized DUF497 family protein